MSNVETVKHIYDAFGRGDIPAIIDRLADDVVWEQGGADWGIPWLTPGTGKDHVGRFFGLLADLEFRRFELEAILDGGDLVVGLLHVDAAVRSTGGSFGGPEAHLWRFGPDGKVCAFNHLLDTHAMVLAAKGAPVTA
jgi:hypothetical protein